MKDTPKSHSRVSRPPHVQARRDVAGEQAGVGLLTKIFGSLVVVAAVSFGAAFFAARSENVLAVAALLLSAIAVAAFAISWSITRPLERIVDALRKISEGNFNVFLPGTTTDEFGEISVHLNAIAELVKETRAREVGILRLKSEMIRVTAHQLRTPLTAVQWALDILKGAAAGTLTASQRKAVATGVAANKNIIGIVHDLLDVAEVEEGKFQFSFETVDLAGLVEEQVDKLKERAKHGSISLTFSKKPEEVVPPVVGDVKKLHMVLDNLLDNAIKYTPKGGTVTVDIKPQGDYVEVLITDSGIGIAEEDIPRLFDKFFRSKKAVQMATEGTGLGLFIARNVVVRHGGELRVRSQEGKGTTISFTVPTKKELIPSSEVFEKMITEEL